MSGNNGDAISSFSGYLYQSDVGLLVSLKKISEIKNQSSFDVELSKWSLGIEGEEDVVLFYNEYPKESFQVKETRKKNRSDYTIPVLKLWHCFKDKPYSRFLITQHQLDGSQDTDFFGGLYAGDGLTKNQETLKYLKDHIGFLGDMVECYVDVEQNTKLRFKDEQTVESVRECLITGIGDFMSHFKHESFGDSSLIESDILNEMSRIRNSSTDDIRNHFRYWESKIKRWIQANRDIPVASRVPIPLHEIYSDLLDIHRLSLTTGDYRDIFFNLFIKKFREEIGKCYVTGARFEGNEYLGMLRADCGSDTDYDSRVLELEKAIGYIFSDPTKTASLIKHTLACPDFDKIDELTSFLGLDDLLEKVADFGVNIQNKVQFLIAYFYAKGFETSGLGDDFFSGDESELILFDSRGARGIITGIHYSSRTGYEGINVFLDTEIYATRERDCIGILDRDNQLLWNHQGKVEKEFRDVDGNGNRMNNVTRPKELKIFGGKNCTRSKAQEFMSIPN